GSRDVFSQLVDAGERVLGGQLGVAGPVGVNVVGVLKGDLPFLGRAAAERQVAAGDEDQIAVEPPVVIDGATAIDRRMKTVVATQRVECCRGRKQLSRRSRNEQLFAIPLQDDFACLEIDEQK